MSSTWSTFPGSAFPSLVVPTIVRKCWLFWNGTGCATTIGDELGDVLAVLPASGTKMTEKERLSSVESFVCLGETRDGDV